MAIEYEGTKLGFFTASVDMSTKQYCFVKITGDLQLGTCTDVTDQIVGVAKNNPLLGDPVELQTEFVSKVQVGAVNMTAGELVSTDVNGNAVLAVTGSHVYGTMAASALAGSIGSVLVGAVGIILA